MPDHVIEQDAAKILIGDGDRPAFELLTFWHRNFGIIGSSIIPHFDKLILLDAFNPNTSSPRILYQGETSLASRIMGSKWAMNPVDAADAFDADYRKLVGTHYLKAETTQTPIFDLVATHVYAGNGLNPRRYERLILPVKSQLGAKFLLCYSFETGSDLRESSSGPSDEYPIDQRQQSRHLSNPAV
ncbi:MAG: hypothetical protein ABJJ38_17290 [Roseibium sp.]|uniref:hypothetical protein n=1 Tax=Roseibium sp. TaxID=1936156 RepID=UPI0032985BDC